jgi:hypothetical protein
LPPCWAKSPFQPVEENWNTVIFLNQAGNCISPESPVPRPRRLIEFSFRRERAYGKDAAGGRAAMHGRSFQISHSAKPFQPCIRPTSDLQLTMLFHPLSFDCSF